MIHRLNGLKARWRRKFIHTTDSRHNLPVADNVLDRCFNPSAGDQVWVCDITYIRTASGWLYLAAVMDLYSRRIVGWPMAPTPPAELVCRALQMAIALRRPKPGLIVHSDRGCQYASQAHRAPARATRLYRQHEPQGQLLGQCRDGAILLNLKMERVWQRRHANHAEAINGHAGGGTPENGPGPGRPPSPHHPLRGRSSPLPRRGRGAADSLREIHVNDVTDYIVGFYNTIRLHSTLGYRSPTDFVRLAQAA